MLHMALSKVSMWTKKWRFELIHSESIRIDFTHKKTTQYPIFANGKNLPNADTIKKLGETFGAKFQ